VDALRLLVPSSDAHQQSADQKQTDDDYLEDEYAGRNHSQNATGAGEIPAGWFHSPVSHVSEIVIPHLPGRNTQQRTNYQAQDSEGENNAAAMR
jgi:hypothetical protein